LAGVRCRGDEFAVAQIVDGVDERLVVPLELVHHFAQILRCDGIKTEMHVEYLEVITVLGHPARLGHQGGHQPPGTFRPSRRE
jgi:hypothetical protein